MTQPVPPPVTSPPASPALRRNLPRGWMLGDYQVEKTLGAGGFGVTYLARDGRLQLPVAIKEYFPIDGALRDSDHAVQAAPGDGQDQRAFRHGLDRFLDEARALAALRHPNVVRVLRYFHENGTAYIVMEYEPGQSLLQWARGRRPLRRDTLMAIVEPLLGGLAAVHEAGFLHRDMKPANIVIREDGSPVLLDFGASRRVVPGRDITAIYSPGFAPPEQYHAKGVHGPWTDLYGLGAVMYWLVTGRTPQDALARGLQDDLLPARELADARVFGEPLLAAIDAALRLPVRHRPPSVAGFREVLAQAARAPLATPPGHALPGAGPQVLAALERLLALQIGPLAHWLVQHEAARAPDLQALLTALAAEVPLPDERARFLQDAWRAAGDAGAAVRPG